MSEVLMTTAAARHSLSPSTLRKWLRDGELKGRLREDRRWVVDEQSLVKALASQSQQSKSMQATRARRKWGGSPPPPGKTDALLTTTEAADLIGVSSPTMLRLVRRHQFAGSYQVNSRWLIPRASLEAYVDGATNGDAPHPKTEPQPELAAVPELLDRLEVVLRELRYAYTREQRTMRRRLRVSLDEAFAKLEG